MTKHKTENREIIAVKYLSNAGLLLTCGESTVLIDPFCRDPNGLYMDTDERIRNELLYDIHMNRIDALIFTHDHGDHFRADDCAAAMQTGKDIKLIGSEEVIRQTLSYMGKQRDQRMMAVPYTQMYQIVSAVNEGSFHIDFCNTLHEGKQYAAVQNLTLLVTVHAKKTCSMEKQDLHLVFTGDAQPDEHLFRMIAEWNSHIDWIFAPFPYGGTARGRRGLKIIPELGNLFMMHFPRADKDSQKWRESAEQFCHKVSDGSYQTVFADHPGKWYSL